MARPSGIILLALLSVLLVTDAPSRGSQVASSLSVISLTRVVHLATATLGPQDKVEKLPAASLVVTSGATDEPPEGPNGFDVLEDGRLLVTDPMRGALSVFDMKGKFLKSWNLGFASDSVTVTDHATVVVREASTGSLHAFDSEGRPQPGEKAALPAPLEAKVAPHENRGTVYPMAKSAPSGGPIPIQFDKPGMTLLSLENLASDAKDDTYVALEATTGDTASGAVNVSKYVRRYAADGKLVCETSELPLNYFVPPVDELRVHKGVIYQLQTTNTEVRVNVWETNTLSSRASR